MKPWLVILSVVLSLVITGCGKKAAFPTRPGKYHAGSDWIYSYEIIRPKTPAEIRVGRLYYQTALVDAVPGTVTNTPFGPLKFFSTPNNQGWLNTLANSVPVFDRKGQPLPTQAESVPTDAFPH